MVKVRVISRSKLEWTKDRASEVPRAHRNYDPKFTPMAKQVEYTRAVRAAKLDRMFAKPFVGAMSGHHDTVITLAVDYSNLSHLASGASDGEMILWDVMTKKPKHSIMAHRHALTGCVFSPDGVGILTSSRDKTCKLWDTDMSDLTEGSTAVPVAEYLGEFPFSGIDHCWNDTKFCTASDHLDVWDINRTKPLQRFEWGDTALRSCAYNKTETSLVACCMGDRGVSVFDTRTKNGHSKVILELSCNSLAWNPMDPNTFVTGSDDWNCYLFDLRVPGRPRSVYQGHIHPVTSVDFSPTGEKIVAGSEDFTVRLWDVNQTNKTTSAEMFHTKRMAKVQSVKFSLDNNYIFSGSEDAIVRVWKSDASRPVRPFRGPEEHSFNYLRSLKEKYSGFEEVRRISNQRNTPKIIRKMSHKKRKISKSEMVREMSRRKSDDLKPLAKKKVVQSLK